MFLSDTAILAAPVSMGEEQQHQHNQQQPYEKDPGSTRRLFFSRRRCRSRPFLESKTARWMIHSYCGFSFSYQLFFLLCCCLVTVAQQITVVQDSDQVPYTIFEGHAVTMVCDVGNTNFDSNICNRSQYTEFWNFNLSYGIVPQNKVHTVNLNGCRLSNALCTIHCDPRCQCILQNPVEVGMISCNGGAVVNPTDGSFVGYGDGTPGPISMPTPTPGGVVAVPTDPPVPTPVTTPGTDNQQQQQQEQQPQDGSTAAENPTAYSVTHMVCRDQSAVFSCDTTGQQEDPRVCDFAVEDFTNWNATTTTTTTTTTQLSLQACQQNGFCTVQCQPSCVCTQSDGTTPCGSNCPSPQETDTTTLIPYTSYFFLCRNSETLITCLDASDKTCLYEAAEFDTWNVAFTDSGAYKFYLNDCRKSRCSAACVGDNDVSMCTCVERLKNSDDGSFTGQTIPCGEQCSLTPEEELIGRPPIPILTTLPPTTTTVTQTPINGDTNDNGTGAVDTQAPGGDDAGDDAANYDDDDGSNNNNNDDNTNNNKNNDENINSSNNDNNNTTNNNNNTTNNNNNTTSGIGNGDGSLTAGGNSSTPEGNATNNGDNNNKEINLPPPPPPYSNPFVVCPGETVVFTCRTSDPSLFQTNPRVCDFAANDFESWDAVQRLEGAVTALRLQNCQRDVVCGVNCQSTCQCNTLLGGAPCGTCQNPFNYFNNNELVNYKSAFLICGGEKNRATTATVTCPADTPQVGVETNATAGLTTAAADVCYYFEDDFKMTNKSQTTKGTTASGGATTEYQLNLTRCGPSRCGVGCTSSKCTCSETDDTATSSGGGGGNTTTTSRPCGQCALLPSEEPLGRPDNPAVGFNIGSDDDDRFGPTAVTAFYTPRDAIISCPVYSFCHYNATQFSGNLSMMREERFGNSSSNSSSSFTNASSSSFHNGSNIDARNASATTVWFTSRDVLTLVGCTKSSSEHSANSNGGGGASETAAQKRRGLSSHYYTSFFSSSRELQQQQQDQTTTALETMFCEIICSPTCACTTNEEMGCRIDQQIVPSDKDTSSATTTTYASSSFLQNSFVVILTLIMSTTLSMPFAC